MRNETPQRTGTEDSPAPWYFRLVVGVLIVLMTTGLLLAVAIRSPAVAGLKWMLLERMPASGVSHPVTAVLLNFRGYDTLLEMCVLLLVLMVIWSLAAAPQIRESPAGPVQDSLARLLLPLIILVAGYLLWKGMHAPGGAFQAGALLAAAGILLLLSDWRLPSFLTPGLVRLMVVAGVAVFSGVAVGTLWANSFLLTYPLQWTNSLMILIEFFATVSIGAILIALFIGGRP